MKIDIHVHTKERSLCGKSSEIEQVCAAIDAGLDAIVFTDHNQLAPAATIELFNKTYAPFRIFGGIEVTVEGEDIVVLGMHDPKIESRDWLYPDLHAYIREQGGFLAIAHPFRYHPDIKLPLEEFPPDAIEVYSRNTPRAASGRIIELAKFLDISPLSNSDAHIVQSLGNNFNLLDRDPADEKELMHMLRVGSFTAVMHDVDNPDTVYRLRRDKSHAGG